MASSIERFLIRRTPVIIVDETPTKRGKFRSRRKRGDDDKNSSKKMKRQASVEELPAVKVESQILWTNKYKPNHIGEMIGSRDKFIEIKRYVENWISGDENEAILIIGPPGVGKTCLVYAIARELQYKIFEVNCGLAKKIVYTTEKLHETIQTHQVVRNDTPKLTNLWSSPDLSDRDDLPEISLSSNSIILFDDIDFMISNTVNGFWRALKALIQESKKPIILTATRYCDYLENAISPLKIFEIDPPQPEEIVKHLSSIVSKESSEAQTLKLSPNVTTFNGDVRRTLNEHQYNCEGSEETTTRVPIELTLDDDTPPQIKRFNFWCANDVITAQAGIINTDQTRSYFMDGKDIPFDQMIDCRQTADDIISTIEILTHKVFGERPDPIRKDKELEFRKFNSKLNDVVKKHGRFMSRQTIATEFFPYLSLITAHQNSRRYHTRGSRTAKITIGPVDPFLMKFSVID